LEARFLGMEEAPSSNLGSSTISLRQYQAQARRPAITETEQNKWFVWPKSHFEGQSALILNSLY